MLHQRARPLLGTLVMLRLRDENPARAEQAMAQAFEAVALIDRLMSAHQPGSDLHRLAGARAGDLVELHPHTARVLVLAHYWQRQSAGAFDPLQAGAELARRGLRPALAPALGQALARWSGLEWVSPQALRVDGALPLDLGGIAKGYAVDCALTVLRQHGVPGALVNAGGDLRAYGPMPWPIELRLPDAPTRTRRQPGLRGLREVALASSVSGPLRLDWVPTGRSRPGSRRQQVLQSTACTVMAPDCVSADALTKWVLQCPAGAPQGRLARVLRAHRARVWQA